MGKTYKNTKGRTGRKNLKRLSDGRIKNQHGVIFTDKEKRALESAVVSANRRRSQQLKEVATLPRTVRGKDTGDTLATKLQMGFESDFIITKKSKSLQRFKDRTEFNRYMEYLKKVNSGEYLDERTRLYKRNYMKALDRVHGDNEKDVKMKVRMMKPAEFRKLIEQEELIEISDVYATQDKASELERIRASFGMKSKDEDPFYEYEDIEGF
jgi:hypothetical protein